jgi:regulator of protease activity HflC (stomatin/prohibitin superfamily)
MDHLLLVVAILAAVALGLWIRARIGDDAMAKTVHEWEHGLLYVEGRFQRVLPPGRYFKLLTTKEIFVLPKWQQFLFVPQVDVISADRLVFRVSATPIYRIEDPRAAQESKHEELIRAKVSSALVNHVAGRTLEEFLAERPALEAALLAAITAPIAGCVIEGIAFAQVTLPPELRRVYSEVQRAKLESLAALERARGEQAALRSLANSARMLKGNPELMNLRVLQALSAPGSRGQSMLVMSPTGLVPVPAQAGEGALVPGEHDEAG